MKELIDFMNIESLEHPLSGTQRLADEIKYKPLPKELRDSPTKEMSNVNPSDPTSAPTLVTTSSSLRSNAYKNKKGSHLTEEQQRQLEKSDQDPEIIAMKDQIMELIANRHLSSSSYEG